MSLVFDLALIFDLTHAFAVNTRMGIVTGVSHAMATQPCAPAFQRPARRMQLAVLTLLASVCRFIMLTLL
jgi:hypothetical protein